MNLKKIIQLKDYLHKTNNTEVNFVKAFGSEDYKVLGIDEFPHDREFVQAFFELSDKDFDYLFTPASIKINTLDEYLVLLSCIIHLKQNG